MWYPLTVKVCAYCGEPFEPSGRNASRQKYCNRDHYAVCAYCGKKFLIQNISNGVPKCCSRECSNKFRIVAMNAKVKEKYGVDNVSQSSEVQKKASLTREANKESVLAKRRATNMKRYGGAAPMHSEAVKAKSRATNLEKYGVDNPAKSDEIRKRISEALSSEDVREKYSQQSLERYGTAFPAQSEEVQDKMKSTCLEKYGTEWASQSTEVKSKIRQGIYKNLQQHPEVLEKHNQSVHETCLKKYGVDWPCQLEQCRDSANSIISLYNVAFGEELNKQGFVIEYEKHLGPYSYDIYLPEIKTFIEINPTYTHSVEGNHWNSSGKDQYYHRDKLVFAERQGFRCIEVWDWDSMDKVLQIISRNKVRLFARNCKLSEVSLEEVSTFLENYHLQGSCRNQIYRFGLYYQDMLVEVMTFGKPRYTSQYDFEMLRLCTRPDFYVVGGAEKLLKHFRDSNLGTIISYCDRSKFSGHVYARLGMTLKYTSAPAKIWSRGSEYVRDSLLRQRGYDQLFDTDFGKGSSNEDLMHNAGWRAVYDCGQAVYVL